MSGREDTKLDRLIVNCLVVVDHSKTNGTLQQHCCYVYTSVRTPALFVVVAYTTARPLRPLDHQTRPIPAESRSAIATIGLARSDQSFPLATLVGYLVYAL